MTEGERQDGAPGVNDKIFNTLVHHEGSCRITACHSNLEATFVTKQRTGSVAGSVFCKRVLCWTSLYQSACVDSSTRQKEKQMPTVLALKRKSAHLIKGFIPNLKTEAVHIKGLY